MALEVSERRWEPGNNNDGYGKAEIWPTTRANRATGMKTKSTQTSPMRGPATKTPGRQGQQSPEDWRASTPGRRENRPSRPQEQGRARGEGRPRWSHVSRKPKAPEDWRTKENPRATHWR
jgi:hypothetical protein